MRGHSEAHFRLIQETFQLFPLVVLEQQLRGADLQPMLVRMACLGLCEPGYIAYIMNFMRAKQQHWSGRSVRIRSTIARLALHLMVNTRRHPADLQRSGADSDLLSKVPTISTLLQGTKY